MITCAEKGLPQYFGRLRPGSNLLSPLKSPDHSRIRILILGGDLKHVLSSLPESSDGPEVEFVLSESNWEIQARNAFLLRILGRAEKVDDWIVKSFIQIYYSLHLEDDVYALYFKALREAIDDNKDLEEDPRYKVLWKEWIKLGWSLKFGEKLRQSRVDKIKAHETTIQEHLSSPHLDEVEKEMTRSWYDNGLFIPHCPAVKRANPTLTCLNPLNPDFKPISPQTQKDELAWLFPDSIDDRLIYAPHAIDSPFQDWDPCSLKAASKRSGPLELTNYIRHMSELVTRARKLLLSSKLKIRLLVSHIDALPRLLPASSFNVIDTLLLADLQGTFNTLDSVYPLLNTSILDSCVLTHHRVWQLDPQKHSFKSHIESQLGIEALGRSRHDFSHMKSPPCQSLTMPDNFLRSLVWHLPKKKAQSMLTTKLSERIFRCRLCGGLDSSGQPEDEKASEVSWSSQYESSSSSSSSSYDASTSSSSGDEGRSSIGREVKSPLDPEKRKNTIEVYTVKVPQELENMKSPVERESRKSPLQGESLMGSPLQQDNKILLEPDRNKIFLDLQSRKNLLELEKRKSLTEHDSKKNQPQHENRKISLDIKSRKDLLELEKRKSLLNHDNKKSHLELESMKIPLDIKSRKSILKNECSKSSLDIRSNTIPRNSKKSLLEHESGPLDNKIKNIPIELETRSSQLELERRRIFEELKSRTLPKKLDSTKSSLLELERKRILQELKSRNISLNLDNSSKSVQQLKDSRKIPEIEKRSFPPVQLKSRSSSLDVLTKKSSSVLETRVEQVSPHCSPTTADEALCILPIFENTRIQSQQHDDELDKKKINQLHSPQSDKEKQKKGDKSSSKVPIGISSGKLVQRYVRAWDIKIERDSAKPPITSHFKPSLSSFGSLSRIKSSFESPRRAVPLRTRSVDSLLDDIPFTFVKSVVKSIDMSATFPEENISVVVESGSEDKPRKSSLLQIPEHAGKRKQSVTFGQEDTLIRDHSKEDGLNNDLEGGKEEDESNPDTRPEDYRPPTPPGKSHTIQFPRTPPSTPEDS